MAGKKRVGIVLFQLGGPDSLDAVEPFLLDLFLDPDIITARPAAVPGCEVDFFASVRSGDRTYGANRPALAHRATLTDASASLGAALVAVHRSCRGGGHALLASHSPRKHLARFEIAGPLDEIRAAAALPALFLRHHSRSMKEWRRVRCRQVDCPMGADPSTPSNISTIILLTSTAWLKSSARILLASFPDSSRDSLDFQRPWPADEPGRKGRPYPRQIEETVRLTCEQGADNLPAWPRTHILCYQSRVGPAKWLQPPLTATIERLAHEGVKEMLVVPISSSPSTSKPCTK